MCQHFSKKNYIEVLVSGPKEHSGHVQSVGVKSPYKPRNLGRIMDPHLNLENHIKLIIKTVYYHLTHVARIRQLMSQQDSEALPHLKYEICFQSRTRPNI
ncbi:hypothetical protein GOODEAATRI_024032 [Goodea atripinnis]|uniref:Uncharacterized protein n=1 Tax=Goodea atripinnis TaxID=208336 RepID=A0ABV0PR77_9TELE